MFLACRETLDVIHQMKIRRIKSVLFVSINTPVRVPRCQQRTDQWQE